MATAAPPTTAAAPARAAFWVILGTPAELELELDLPGVGVAVSVSSVVAEADGERSSSPAVIVTAS